MKIIETKSISYKYSNGNKDKNALDNVSISFEKGSTTAILGGNGAGKSTLFLNLNGVLKPDSGSVYLNEKIVNYDAKGIKTLRESVGIVFQDPNDQLFSANVRSDISFGALNIGFSEDDTRKMVHNIAEYTGITSILDKPTHALSFGQKKRVAIAGVLIMRPEVIILDEPTAGLDPHGITEILDLLMQIKKDTGASIIISTHDIDIVPLYCNYAYVFSEGSVVMKGTPKEVFSNSITLNKYGLRTPRITHLMNILNKKDGLNVDVSAGTISEARATIKNLFYKSD